MIPALQQLWSATTEQRWQTPDMSIAFIAFHTCCPLPCRLLPDTSCLLPAACCLLPTTAATTNAAATSDA